MKRAFLLLCLAAWVVSLSPAPAEAQLGGLIRNATKAKDAFDGVNITAEQELQIGTKISEQLRKRYGVVQNPDLHKYVTLVGQTVAAGAKKQNLKWTFIVLDTDGVNAHAAPGGFVHITRGALALIRHESELAAVLGHEIEHIDLAHTINDLRKSNAMKTAKQLAPGEVIENLATAAFTQVRGHVYDSKQEDAADEAALTLANAAGYAPTSLGTFLERLVERNQAIREPKPDPKKILRNGMFSSHPEMQERIADAQKVIEKNRLAAVATVTPRYASTVKVTALSVEDLAIKVADAQNNMSAAEKAEKGIASAQDTIASAKSLVGGAPTSRQTATAAQARNLNVDGDAPGGANSTLVTVTITAAELQTFKQGIA
jgi:predicted Zn-dependent protease